MSPVKDVVAKPVKPVPPPTAPVSVPQQQQQQAPPPPGQYAGVPAYRWYGYGSPTPGANPYAPTGLSPRGSANWYQHSGATPGAFPVPVAATPRSNGHEPPSYLDSSPPSDGHYLAGTRIPMVTSSDLPPPVAPSTQSQYETAHSIPMDGPQMPMGSGVPVTGVTTAGDLTWQPSATRPNRPIATTPNTPTSFDPTWQPSTNGTPVNSTTPTPSVSMIRGQAPLATSEDVDGTIRTACYGRASAVTVTHTGQKKLHVKLTAPTESDARDAAAVVSGLPQLKAYSITFEATIGR